METFLPDAYHQVELCVLLLISLLGTWLMLPQSLDGGDWAPGRGEITTEWPQGAECLQSSDPNYLFSHGLTSKSKSPAFFSPDYCSFHFVSQSLFHGNSRNSRLLLWRREGKPFVSLAASGSNSSTDCWQANGSIFSAILMGCKVLVNLQISVLRVMY